MSAAQTETNDYRVAAESLVNTIAEIAESVLNASQITDRERWQILYDARTALVDRFLSVLDDSREFGIFGSGT